MARVHSLLNLIKNFDLWAFLTKIVNLGIDPHISDAKTDPFFPFGASLFVYFKYICIQIIEKITGKIVYVVFAFLQSTGLKKPVCEPSPFEPRRNGTQRNQRQEGIW